MIPGDVVLARLPEGPSIGGKLRPAVVIASLPALVPTVLLCGISSRVHRRVDGRDIVVGTDHPDYATSGLHVPSVIRPSWLLSVPDDGMRRLGRVSEPTLNHVRLLVIGAIAVQQG